MTRPTRRLGALLGASVAAAVVLATAPAPAESATSVPRPVPTFVPDGTVCYEVLPDRICHVPLRLTGPAEAATVILVSTAEGTARPVADYAPLTRLPVSIPAGVAAVEIRVAIVPDGVDEGDETFYLLISSASEPARILERIPVVIRDGAPPK